MKKEVVKTLDFLEYKKTGKLSYIEVEVDPVPKEEEMSFDTDEALAKMAEVMSLSTDELFLEIGFILERGESPRNLDLEMLATELSGRLVLMESICLYVANLDKS